MVLQGFPFRIRPIEFLTQEQLIRFHEESLKVLRDTGVVFKHEEALKVLNQAGCQIDRDRWLAKIPSGLVEDCLNKCPRGFVVKARNPKFSLEVGQNRMYVGSSTAMDTVDLDTWERRTPTLKDQDDSVRVLDALDNIHRLCYGPYHHLEGVPEYMIQIVGFASRIRNSSKTTFSGSVGGCEKWTTRMAKATDQQCFGLVCPSSPLTYYRDSVEAMFEFVGGGMPIYLDSGPLYGSTAPVTLAGATVMTNSELMAGIVLLQLIKPGYEILVSTFSNPIDMRHGIPDFGAVERAIQNAMFNQIWRNHGIPVHTCSEFSSGKIIDYQAGYEKSVQFLLAALSGPSILSFAGGLYGELTYHPVMSVLDDDLSGVIGRVLRGSNVTDETLATYLINEVGPIPGHFLGKRHTIEMWGKEYFRPKVADKLPYPLWIKRGKKGALVYAKERVEQIVQDHKPVPLTEDQDNQISNILREAEQWHRKNLIQESSTAGIND